MKDILLQSVESEHRNQYWMFAGEKFVDLNLYQFGWEATQALHMFGPAARSHYLFHYIISGEGKLETGGQTFYLHAGQGFLLYPGQVSTYFSSESDPWTYAWIEFDGIRARESLTIAGLTEKDPVFDPDSPEDGQKVLNELTYILNHHDESALAIIGHGFLFLSALMNANKKNTGMKTGTKKLQDYYLQEAVNFINANYQRDISIDDIATVCGLNRSYFGRIFKAAYGESPQTFLMHLRLTKAAELLRGTLLPVGAISNAVGYENQLHFSRAFKLYFGLSPREYRQKHFNGALSDI